MTQPDYSGYYQLDTLVVKVIAGAEGPVAVFPGTPPGFEVKSEPTSQPHTFIMAAGPVAGAPFTFQFDEDGQVTALVVGGEYTLRRLAEPPAPSAIPSGQGLPAPSLALDAKKEAAFAALVDQIETRADGAEIDYTLPYPKHEFMMYAAQQDKFIFHGSGNGDIDEFVTRRTSMELNDRSGRGNVQGVYGTHDGLWPLFFAVIDRKTGGTIRNGFNIFHNDAGEEIAVYHFSINKDYLTERPYHTGTLYILPRDTFRRLPATAAGGLSNEWVSEVPVKPLARLTIEPEDFPFLDQIGGHDDSALIAMQALEKQILGRGEAARPLTDGFSLKLAWDEELAQMVFAYVPRVQQFIPTARLALRFEPNDGVWLDFRGPPAVNSVMVARLKKSDIPFLDEAADTAPI